MTETRPRWTRCRLHEYITYTVWRWYNEQMKDCIEWTGSRTTRGYGQRRANGQRIYVHRWAWQQVNGPIPPGYLILHRCDNPPCYNVNHLFIGTQADNMADAQRKGKRPTSKHGTPWHYSRYKCRCSKCRAANSKYCAKYRAQVPRSCVSPSPD